jgi:uncharacterized UPF0160 family protein
MLHIVTHDGPFHEDEVAATAMICMLHGISSEDEKLKIERTRLKARLDWARENPHVWMVDVGLDYRPAQRNFDHHQHTTVPDIIDGVEASASGLVWNFCGYVLTKRKCRHTDLNDTQIMEIVDRISRRLAVIDLSDNGVARPVTVTQIDGDDHYFTPINYVTSLNSDNVDNSTAQLKRFKTAVGIMILSLKKIIGTAVQKYLDEQHILRAIERCAGQEVLEIPVYYNALKIVIEQTEFKYMMWPEGNHWALRTVPIKSSGFAARAVIPTDKEVEGVDFIHKGGWIAKGRKEALLELIKD